VVIVDVIVVIAVVVVVTLGGGRVTALTAKTGRLFLDDDGDLIMEI
jgi:hypothetical protein